MILLRFVLITNQAMTVHQELKSWNVHIRGSYALSSYWPVVSVKASSNQSLPEVAICLTPPDNADQHSKSSV